MTQKGDLQLQTLAQKGDSRTAGPLAQAEKGDFQVDGAALARQKGDFSSYSINPSHRKGDFQVDGAALSINDIDLYNRFSNNQNTSVNVNDIAGQLTTHAYSSAEAKKIGLELANFLEGHEKNVGGFVEKCKTRTPTIIRAAVIDALVHAYFPGADPRYNKGKQLNRAACFHTASNRYAEPDVVFPAFVQHWLATNLTWLQIEDALKEASKHYKIYMLPGDERAVYVRQWLCGEITQQELDQNLQTRAFPEQNPPNASSVQSRQSESKKQGKTVESRGERSEDSHFLSKDWLNQDEADTLARRIESEAREARLDVTEVQVKSEQNAFVVEVTAHGHRVIFKSAVGWQRYYSSVRETLLLQEQFKQSQALKGGSRGTH
jgi:hypothetical protein